MLVRLVLQPFAHHLSLHEVLTDALASTEFDELLIVVAWAKESGFRRLRSAIAEFRGRGGVAKIVVGIDEGGATVEGLNAAIAEFDESKVIFDRSSGTFHPKIYCVYGASSALVVIGSSNLTAGGLFRNYEASAVLDLDLTVEGDADLFRSVLSYANEISADGTSVELNQTLRELLETTPAFRIASEAASRSASQTHDEESFGIQGQDTGSAPSPFGKSGYRKKRDPLPGLSGSDRSEGGRSTSTASAAGSESVGASEQGGSTAELMLRWTKKLTRSDCGRPREGSNTTGALRFTKAGHHIDSATWFRENLFVNADWSEDHALPGREITQVRFEVRIGGIERGTHPLQLKYDGRREAGQRNFTTDLKWGPLSQVVRSEDLTDQWIAVERLDDGTMRIEITADEPAAVIPEP